MKSLQLEATITQEGTLTVKGLPLLAGHRVFVLVQDLSGDSPSSNEKYPLRNETIRYDQPFESVAESDWHPLQ